jgi:type I restriction enzyme S subunit
VISAAEDGWQCDAGKEDGVITANSEPYTTKKESDVEWIENVPRNWKVSRLKHVCRLAYGDALSADIRKRGKVPVLGSNGKLGRHHVANTQSPCIVIGRKGSFGKVNYSQEPVFAIDTTFYVDRRRSHADMRWLFYVMKWLGLDQLSKDAAVPGLSREDAYCRIVPLPPRREQTTIARFLDHIDRDFQRYIRAKQRLIALLEEQRQVIVHQAVTGQIDVRTGQPYPAYKVCSVEWIGSVPKHWEVRRIKSLSIVKRGASPRPIGDSRYFDGEGEYAWVRIADVTASNNYLQHTTQRLSQLGQSLSVRLRPGALFLSIAGSVGKPIITRIKCCIHDGFVYFPRFSGNAEFLRLVLSCRAPYARLGKLGTQLNLNTDTVGGIHIGWPSEAEQSAIVGYLVDATNGIESAIALAKRQMTVLKEFLACLVANVVTGKLDVRDVAASSTVDGHRGEDDPNEFRL